MSRKKQKKNPVSVICSTLGTAMLVVLVLICLPLTIPRMAGYELYTVISGSMEPTISVGSLVYIKGAAPEDMQEKDVIAFYGASDSNAIITHRVVENRVVMGEFITKGDANDQNDIKPVPYENFIGKVSYSIPIIGNIAQFITSTKGKIVAAGIISLALLLQLIAAAVNNRKS